MICSERCTQLPERTQYSSSMDSRTACAASRRSGGAMARHIARVKSVWVSLGCGMGSLARMRFQTEPGASSRIKPLAQALQGIQQHVGAFEPEVGGAGSSGGVAGRFVGAANDDRNFSQPRVLGDRE